MGGDRLRTNGWRATGAKRSEGTWGLSPFDKLRANGWEATGAKRSEDARTPRRGRKGRGESERAPRRARRSAVGWGGGTNSPRIERCREGEKRHGEGTRASRPRSALRPLTLRQAQGERLGGGRATANREAADTAARPKRRTVGRREGHSEPRSHRHRGEGEKAAARAKRRRGEGEKIEEARPRPQRRWPALTSVPISQPQAYPRPACAWSSAAGRVRAAWRCAQSCW